MNKLRFGKKVVLTLLLLTFVLCLSVGTVFTVILNGGLLKVSAETTVGSQTSNGNGSAVDVAVEYTYGQTYTIGGHDFTLGSDGIDYKTALGLNVTRSGDDCNVTLKSFTYFDGSDGTAETDSVRNAGTYVFTIERDSESGVLSQDYTVRVNRAGLDFSTVDWIPVFVNTGSPYYKAHGDITSVYKHNDGWYPSQKADEVPVEIRTITNAYYYETHNTDKSNLISIKIANEKLTGVEDKNPGDLSDAEKQIKTSTLKYNDDITFNITDRAGVAFTTSNEYIATFTFHIPQDKQNNYYFDYGNKTEDDEISDSNKGLSITQRTEDSFILSKHWFIVKSADLFMAVGDTASFPYVPFHDNAKLESANGLTNITEGNIEGIRGETNTATDTVKYTESFTVKPPIVKLGGVDGTIKFDVTYVDLNGIKHRIATDVALDTQITYDTDGKTIKEAHSNLEQYFNETMPAGRYTLKLYGIRGSDKIIGEYWLTVLPKEIDSTLVSGIQQAIRGDLDESVQNGATDIEQYFNSYALGANKLHKDLTEELGALNSSLNNTLNGMSGKSYWSDLTATAQKQYFDTAVTLMYNRNSWSSSNYVTEDDMTGMLSTYGSYTIYYSISAKNYVTVGGADDVNRTQYGFRTVLYTGIKVSDIYNSITNATDPYFKDVTFNGGDAKTSVPQNAYYVENFDDDEYVNVGRHYVTLTLRDNLTSWDTALPESVEFEDYFELCGVNNRSLKVYFEILPADNSWNVMPQMPSWAFNGFDKSVNEITAGLKFDSTVKYALIPNTVSNPNSVEWGIANNSDGIVFFTVDENSMVDDTTAALLNSLKPASYYLKFYVSEVVVTVTDGETSKEITNVNAYSDIARNSAGNPLATVTVSKATNSWTSTPNVMTWIWGSYDSDRNPISAAATYPALKPTCGNIVDESFVYTNGGAALPVITFSIRKAGDITPIEGLERFTTVDETIAAILETLHAGKYDLTTSVGGSDYYTEIAETKLTFAIAQAGNSWTTTPQVVQWTWGNYSANRNIISAATEFTGGDGSQANSDDKPILFTVLQVVNGNRVAVINLENFQVGSDGKITDSSAAAAFAALHAGSYYLRAEKLGNNDYTDIIGSDSTDIPFSVAQATSTWTTTPSMTSWQYGGFVNGNFRLGEPKYVNTDKPVTYVISMTNGNEFTFGTQTGTSFALEFNDGVLASSMYDALKTLHIGDYKIAVRQEETDDFSELTHTFEFAVLKTTNTWSTSPSVIGWIYGSYNDSYFTAGVPTFNESKDEDGNLVKVKYTLTKKAADGVSDDSKFTPIVLTNPNKAFFEQLNAGSYSLSVYYAASDNYSALTATVTFTIGKCTNTWETPPSLRSWDYKSFTPSLFTAGKPRLTTSVDDQGNPVAVTYLLTGGNFAVDGVALTVITNDDGTLSLSSDSIIFLAALSADSYILEVSYAGSDNYDLLSQTINFQVSKVSNGWATRPRVIGWTFGSFDISYFIAGVPTLNESKEGDNPAQVKYTLVNSNGDYVALDNYGKVASSTTEQPLTEAQVKSLLAMLGADSYTLSASYAGTANYDALKAEDTQITFKVSPFTNNNWKDGISPEISGWTYGEFTASLFTTGEPERGEVTYTVRNATTDEIAKVDNTLLENLSYATLKGLFDNLGFGVYKLQATSGSTADYEAVTWNKPFEVAKAANSWTKYPNITGWTYGSAPNSYTAGTTQYATGDITYTYYSASRVSSGLVANTTLDPVTISSTTPAGDYAMVVVAPASGNYDRLTYTVFFTVSKLTTAWDTTTTDSNGETFNWIYKSNDNTTLNAPVLGNWADGAITYTITNDSGAQIYSGSVWNGTSGVNGVIETLTNQKAGSYVVTANVAGDVNHTALSYSVTLVVSVAPNEWVKKGSNLTVEYGTAITIEYQPKFNAEEMTIKVNNSKVDDLNEYFNLRGVGTYTITVTVEADTAYGALEDTITVTITRTSNGWAEDTQLEIIQKDGDGNDTTGWVWGDLVQNLDDGVGVKTPVPQNGSKVIITVYRDGSEQFTATLNYDETVNKKIVNGNDLDALIAKLRALDVGTYSITAEIPESADYAAFAQDAFEFTVEKATNSWIKEPDIIGWNYNSTTAYPDATPKYGNKNDVEYSYVAKGDYATAEDVPANEWQATQPILGGVYYLRGVLHGTDNYDEIVGYCTFSIGTGDNAWVNMPGVITWTWNNYNKEINQFSGSARSGGAVTFTITKVGASDNEALGKGDLSDTSLDVNKLQGFTFVKDADGKVTKYISDDVAQVLNALKPGKYNLYAVVAADENYQSVNGSMTFEVGKANNAWITAPNMLSYGFGSTVAGGDRQIFTAGKSKYGTDTIVYQITGAANDGTEFSLDNDNLVASDIVKLINGQYKENGKTVVLNAGNYILKAWVAAGQNYNEFYSQSAPYSVLFSVARIENGWKENNEPQTSISAYYTDLHQNTFNFNGWFVAPQTIYDDEIAYALLNTDQTVAKAGEFKYSQLFDAIKGLPAGDYIIHMSVKESGNYWALTADTSVSIQRYSNQFTAFPSNNRISGQWQLSGEWKPTDNTNATTLDLDTFTVTASKGNDTITYTINGVKCDTLAKFKEEVAKLNAGSYQVTIEVAQTNDYDGLSRTVQLDVKQGANNFTVTADNEWTWHDGKNHLAVEDLTYGSQVYVAITKDKADSALSYITIDFSIENPLSVLNQIIGGTKGEDGQIVGGLDAGKYSVTVTARDSSNWAEVSKTVTITINKTQNGWVKDNEPALDEDNLKDGVYKYEFGDSVTPSALAQHGTVKYTYYVNNADYANGNAKPLASKPANVGKYVVEISVDATANHNGIEATVLYFDIDKVLNDGFIVSPAAVGWTWGIYDREVHMFTGIPRSGGSVSFSILDENKVPVSIDGIKLDKMLLVGFTENGEQHYNDVDKDMYLESKFAPLVAKLLKGNYYLQINVDETINNTSFTATAPFRVDAAKNGWKVTPKIASWSLELWSEEKNTPQAEPLFGTPRIVVTSQNNNEVFYDNMYFNTETGEHEVLNRLENALAGWYKMTVTVDGLDGCYDGLFETVDVQVYMRGSNETKNYWYETFGIVSWEAIVNGIGNQPYGTPLRGLPYFEFYYAKGEGSSAEIDWDKPVVAGEDSYLVKKGDNKYYKDFYVPMAPGYYFMVACAVNVDSDGKVIEADNLREIEKPYPLHIEYRANGFTDDPRIDTLLFLGERANWAKPTATASIADSDIWFTYQNIETGEDLGTAMPNAAGKYRVTAHILAKYSEEKTKYADFTVKLSTNSWTVEPTIEDWSEEFGEKEPEAKVEIGEIIYTYQNLATGEVLNAKPTTEGTYKMTATVKAEGYEDLVSTTTFTIDPAYDKDLILIDIVLGFVACALAVFVIIFAIRRYKEN